MIQQNILQNYSEALSSLKQSIELDPNNSTALHLYATMLNQQKSPECVSFYEKSLKINGRSYLTFNGLGNFYLKTNQFEKAENSYSKAIEINPNNYVFYISAGARTNNVHTLPMFAYTTCSHDRKSPGEALLLESYWRGITPGGA